MPGFLCLAGGQELWGAMREPDAICIKLAGGWRARIAVVATAAVEDNSQKRAGRSAIKWFIRRGAPNVRVVPIVDRISADSAENAQALRKANLIYLLGGSPHLLATTLRGTASGAALTDAWHSGSLISGSSAGAMVLCQHYINPKDRMLYPGFNFIPNSIVLPHHNSFGQTWVPHLRQIAPDSTLIGLDDHTAIINDQNDSWQVSGVGGAHLYQADQPQIYTRAETFQLAIADH